MAETNAYEKFVKSPTLSTHIHQADRVVFRDEVVEALRQQGDLSATVAFDESLNLAPLDE